MFESSTKHFKEFADAAWAKVLVENRNQEAPYNADAQHYRRDEIFAELILAKCISIVESQEISVGNSPAGELACEWTLDALRDCKDEINEQFGVK